jgi:hypothetical protein
MKAIPAMTAKTARRTNKPLGGAAFPAQQLLNFLPLPQGQVSFLPTRIDSPWTGSGGRHEGQPPDRF